jgi:hypothetical protein
MIGVRLRTWLSEYVFNNGSSSVYEKEFQNLQPSYLATLKLCALCEKVMHVEGLELEEKVILLTKLTEDILNLRQEHQKLCDEYTHLSQEFLNARKGVTDNPEIFNRKKPVGRPSSKIIYQWMDYLVSELGSKQKAADYASDSPLTDSKKSASLLREYRRYCNDKTEG